MEAYSNMGPHSDAVQHRKVDKAQRKERIIYDMIEVLPPPRNEPVSKSESDSEDKSQSGESSNNDDNESDIYGDAAPREPTIETEPCVFALSSPKELDPRPSAQQVRKPRPEPFDPALYVSAQNEATKHKVQSQVSYAYEATTTIWSESAETELQGYDDAVNLQGQNTTPVAWWL